MINLNFLNINKFWFYVTVGQSVLSVFLLSVGASGFGLFFLSLVPMFAYVTLAQASTQSFITGFWYAFFIDFFVYLVSAAAGSNEDKTVAVFGWPLVFFPVVAIIAGVTANKKVPQDINQLKISFKDPQDSKDSFIKTGLTNSEIAYFEDQLYEFNYKIKRIKRNLATISKFYPDIREDVKTFDFVIDVLRRNPKALTKSSDLVNEDLFNYEEIVSSLANVINSPLKKEDTSVAIESGIEKLKNISSETKKDLLPLLDSDLETLLD
ncbi:MAG: 5-bromo-4-chloroindolyl phosphate hydrolysis family protein [Lactobacillaceae bacterium]|jgi:5-bromo-4-chloroindolyl phosphate hydrolysis protein|nr:5-bromo-4-chloroindolyl phosphate hydrolysis family protein [Lactobacillaceae bacterium]